AHTHSSCGVLSLCTDAAPPRIYTLSLHDALPILAHRMRTDWLADAREPASLLANQCNCVSGDRLTGHVAFEEPSLWPHGAPVARSEEHTSELQSQPNLVCRLLLEKQREHRSDVEH